MDPFTFGIVAVGVAGGTLILISKLNINETAVKIALEATKYGAILWLINHIAKTFSWWF